MKHDRQDRRSQRTRTALTAALVALLHEQPYDAIRIGVLLERANVGRSTFYSHFYDKDDLLDYSIEQVFRALSQHSAPTTARCFDSAALFTHIHSHRWLFTALARGSGLATALRAGQRVLLAISEESLGQAAGPAPAVPVPALAQYLAATFLALVRWWIDQNQPYTPVEMETMYQTLVLPGLERALWGQTGA